VWILKNWFLIEKNGLQKTVKIPSQGEQKKIVLKIENFVLTFDSCYEDLKKISTQLKQYQQSILMKAYSGQLTEKWRKNNLENQPSSYILEKLKKNYNKKLIEKYEVDNFSKSKLPDIPKCWEWVPFVQIVLEKQIGLVRSMSQQKKIGKISYLKMNNITFEGEITLDNLVFVDADNDEVKQYSLRKNDLVFNTRNSFDLVGKTAVWNNQTNLCLYNNNIIRIKISELLVPHFISYFMNSKIFKKLLLSAKKETTNVCAIYEKDLMVKWIPIAPTEEQKIIAKILIDSNHTIEVIQESIKNNIKKIEVLKTSLIESIFSQT